MRKNSDASGKVVAIYEAVNRLIGEGRDVSQIIVSDIAHEAGIGKGTIYDYFENKEEIIGRALYYQLNIIIENILSALDKADSVRDCFVIMADMMDENSSLGMFIDLGQKLMTTSPVIAKSIQEGGGICAVRKKYVDLLVNAFYEKLDMDMVSLEEDDREYIRFNILAMLQMVIAPRETRQQRYMTVDYAMRTLEKVLPAH